MVKRLSPSQFGPVDATRESIKGTVGNIRDERYFTGGPTIRSVIDEETAKRGALSVPGPPRTLPSSSWSGTHFSPSVNVVSVQKQLFDPSDMKEAPAHMQSRREYLADHRTWWRGQAGDSMLHGGTSRSGGTHFGTRTAAEERLGNIEVNPSHQPPPTQELPLDDGTGSWGQLKEHHKNGHIIGVRVEANTPKLGADRWMRKTDAGDNWTPKEKPTFYRNQIEDRGSVSGYVSSLTQLSTWRSSVLGHADEAHPLDVWHAQRHGESSGASIDEHSGRDSDKYEPGRGYTEYNKTQVLHPRLFASRGAFGERGADAYDEHNLMPYTHREKLGLDTLAEDRIQPQNFKPRGHLDDA